jgi:beta-lactam-binding protein with PASTA domain
VTGRKLKKARQIIFARGCKTRVRYLVSKRAKNTVLAQSRKAGKKLSFRSVVQLTIAKPRKH